MLLRNYNILLCFLIALTGHALAAKKTTHALGRHFADSDVAYVLVEASSGKVKASHHMDKPMVLASVSKLFTGYFALQKLGNNFRFETKILSRGKDLYLVGGGDPYLTAPHLLSLVDQIKASGIREVQNFYVDDSALPFLSRLSPIGLEDQADNPSLGALNVEFNRFEVWWQKAQTDPPLSYLEVEKVKERQHGLLFRLKEVENVHERWQQLKDRPKKSLVELPTRHSSFFTAAYLRFMAERQGLKLPHPQRKKAPWGTSEVATHTGLPLERLVALGLEYSNNVIAETMLLQATKQDSLKKAAQQMQSWYAENMPKLNWNKASFANGSGLGLENKVSAKLLAKFLNNTSTKVVGKRSFRSLWSINGHSGGLEKRLRKPEHAFRVYGKTGSLFYVNNLAGELIANSGKRYIFALFITDQQKRDVLAKGNSKEAKRLRGRHSGWYKKAVRAQDKLLAKWIESF